MIFVQTNTGDNMKHEIDLTNYQIRTDLAIDQVKGSNPVIDEFGNQVSILRLDQSMAKKIGKKEGLYVTIEFEDVTDSSNRTQVTNSFKTILKKIFLEKKIKGTSSVLVIGLGNAASTPDSLGPMTIEHILVTNHLFLLSNPEEGFRPVSAFNPGVMGETGIETSDLIKSAIEAVKPDLLIVIDALASSSLSRLNKTIQISDTGILPGSGIGNKRKEISSKTVGVPVLAIGVPTVVDAVTLVSDTFSYMEQHYAFHREFQKKPMSKFVPSQALNYLKGSPTLEAKEKKNLLGLIGGLEEEEIKELLFEVLTPIGYNLMVTPKEVDFLMKNLAEVISNGLNQALHPKLEQ